MEFTLQHNFEFRSMPLEAGNQIQLKNWRKLLQRIPYQMIQMMVVGNL